jgi:hypothetical protein
LARRAASPQHERSRRYKLTADPQAEVKQRIMTALDALAGERRWVAWRNQNGLSPRASARSTSPTTASAIAEALQRAVSSSQPRRRRSASASSSVTPAPKLLTTGCVASAPVINVRVAGGPFWMSATVKAPLAILSSTQVRPAAWKARRHEGRQNFYCFPPSCRGRKDRSHQAQRTASLIAGPGKLSRQ